MFLDWNIQQFGIFNPDLYILVFALFCWLFFMSSKAILMYMYLITVHFLKGKKKFLSEWRFPSPVSSLSPVSQRQHHYRLGTCSSTFLTLYHSMHTCPQIQHSKTFTQVLFIAVYRFNSLLYFEILIFISFFFFFELWSSFAAQGGLELGTLSPVPPECWDYTRVPSCLVLFPSFKLTAFAFTLMGFTLEFLYWEMW